MTFPALLLALTLGSSAVPQDQQAPPPPQAAAPVAAPAQQQPEELVVDVEGGVQPGQQLTIAIPEMPTPAVQGTPAGSTDALGRQMAGIVAGDLRNSGLFSPLSPGSLRNPAFPEVTAPTFDYWGGTGAQALVQGFVRANGDGTLTIGCYLYDVTSRVELTRQGFVVQPGDWRRAGHKCADMVYTRLTGEGGYFDSRVVYVSETGPKGKRVKRLAIMDQDGANHRFLTNGQSIVLTPRFAPNQQSIVYMSYVGRTPAIYVYDIGTGRQRLVVQNVATTFAPRFSPDGRYILFSMAQAGNTDVYRVSAQGGAPQRLTNSPGIDTGGSYSPDGSKIVFESDRSGGQQIYVMNADGSNQQRISFGGGRYATPVWSPRGDLIAFTKLQGSFRIGTMSPSGGGEKLLTDGYLDEGPSWAPNGRVITFLRSRGGRDGRAELHMVDLTGVNERRIPTPLDGSDPAWGPLRP
jgi:TolB protein